MHALLGRLLENADRKRCMQDKIDYGLMAYHIRNMQSVVEELKPKLEELEQDLIEAERLLC